ncbi:MAG: amino acid adenylation domain-containing protein, partial [Verrucomicrobiales bacterium]
PKPESFIVRQRRFVVGFPSAGQNSEGNENIVGHCVNFLPFVANINPAMPFAEFLKETQQRILDAQDHRECTYGRIIQKLGPDRRPVMEAVFNFERMDNLIDLAGLETEVSELDRLYTTNPLFLKAYDTGAGLELRLDFQSSLFSTATAQEWLDTFETILEAITKNPAAPVSMIAESLAPGQWERLREWNRTTTGYPRDKTLSQLFEETAARRTQATAIRFEGANISYAELADLTNRIADSLGESGISPGDRVGLFLERGPEMIASMLAVLKVGAAYVPLDPSHPAERVRYLLEDSGATAVISEKELFDQLPQELNLISAKEAAGRGKTGRAPQGRAVAPESAACLLYTSGSTGKPKGAMITHRGIVRLVKDTNYGAFGDDEVFLQVATVSFDACLYDTYGALCNGGCLVLPPPGSLTIDVIARSFHEESVTQLFLTTGLFQVMVDEKLDAFTGLRRVLTGGDIASPAHAGKFLAAHPGVALINVYGPTENVTFTTTHEITKSDLDRPSIPIGRPISNTTVWILDENGKPVPPGVSGELYTGGDGVALGYLGKPDLTAERFLPDPFSTVIGSRLYRTGDLCRQRPDGTIEFLSRIDHQVKIRGYRIEPGEIETVLGRHPSVRQCKVVVRGADAADKFLAAYVAPEPLAAPTQADLENYLRSKLPAYMVPASFVMLDALPMNTNGKVDTHSLPSPVNSEKSMSPDRPDSPVSAVEQRLTELWKQILRIPTVHRDEDFFALGGHSLLGIKLFSRIQREFGLSLPLAVLFKAPTIRQLAQVIESRIEKNSSCREIAETTVLLQPKGGKLPIFGVHGGEGGVFFYRDLAERLAPDRPFYAFEAASLTNGEPVVQESVEETAARYVGELLKIQPQGPFHLCGYSFGGLVAFEMACQLERSGAKVAFLGLVDTENPAVQFPLLSLAERVSTNWNAPHREAEGNLKRVGHLGKRFGTGLGFRMKLEAERIIARSLSTATNTGWLRKIQVRECYERAMLQYLPSQFSGNLTLFKALEDHDKVKLDPDYGWERVVGGKVNLIEVPGCHITVFHQKNIEAFARAFQAALPNRP